METGTLEKKIAKLPENLKLMVEGYLDAMLTSQQQPTFVSEPEAIYNKPKVETESGAWNKLIQKLEKLSPAAQIEIEQNIEKLIFNSDLEQNPVKPRAKFGELKGFVTYMADDFDAPMEEFKDYA